MPANFKCPGCGAELSWSPGHGDLTCDYCGHFHKDESLATGFEPPLHFIAERGSWERQGDVWGTETKEIACGTCGASFNMEPHIEASDCPFCGSNHVNPHKGDSHAMVPVDAVAPFGVEKNDAIRQFREWLDGGWFKPGALKKAASLGNLDGIYIPVWSFDAKTESKWEAERGHHYHEEEEYEDDEGNTQTRRVRKTRWEDAKGRHTGSWRNVMVNGSKGIEQELFEGLLPFDMGKLAPYNTQFLRGFVAERYQIGLDDGYDTAQKIIEKWVEKACEKAVGGDTNRNLEVDVRYRDPKFKLLLAPVWIAAYEFQGKSYRYIVNGQTGKAHGTSPTSWAKVAGLVFVIVAIIATIAYFASRGG